MVLVWLLGVYTVLVAGSTAMLLRDGGLPDVDSISRSGGEPMPLIAQIITAARLAVLGTIPHLSFPLSVAKALLASTLVLAATLVLLGRPSARSFALQALGANAVFAVVEYILLRHARGAWIDVAARAAAIIQDPLPPTGPVELTRFVGFLWERMTLVLVELGIPFIGALALTRPRTKIYFADAAAAAESAEEEP
jgi:hypothetical protein